MTWNDHLAIDESRLVDGNVTGRKLETGLLEALNSLSVQHSVTTSMLTAVQPLVPWLSMNWVDLLSAGTGTLTIQVKDAAGLNLAERFFIRTWIADAEFSEPDAQTDYSVSTGEVFKEDEADADYRVISDANGTVVMAIDCGGAKTVYCMAEMDGRIWSPGAIVLTAP